MSFLLIRSVQLSTDTAEAWKQEGGRFTRRGRTMMDTLEMARSYDFLINLGKSDFAPTQQQLNGVFLFNHGDDIQNTMWPGAARLLLDEFLPPQPESFPSEIWIKAPGMKGRGKFKKVVDRTLVLPRQWDWQQHIEGPEFRIVTVGHKIVQNLRRHGENGERTYEWIRMRQVDKDMKDLVREAARRVPGHNILAWDVIQGDDRPYILEANACPGMSENTARRIIEQARLVVEENPQPQVEVEPREPLFRRSDLDAAIVDDLPTTNPTSAWQRAQLRELLNDMRSNGYATNT